MFLVEYLKFVFLSRLFLYLNKYLVSVTLLFISLYNVSLSFQAATS
jgi:hypothetical protein